MKLLLIHANRFRYKVREKAIPEAERLTDENRESAVSDALIVFSTVEEGDEMDPAKVARRASEEVKDVANKVKTNRVVVYPYAHLSSSLAAPPVAIRILSVLEDELNSEGFKVVRSPFGWYKSFEISCKGHPLAELSRSVTIEEAKEAPKPKERKEYVVIDKGGVEHPLDVSAVDECEVLKKEELLKEFILGEELGGVPREKPAHIELMKKFELIDYEPASDVGHFRFYPKGTLMKQLLEAFATDLAVKGLKCIQVETPLVYRMDLPDIAGQTQRFHERDYRFTINGKKLTLRFAGDFGLFRMMKDAMVSHKQLPLRVYELSPSYRLEKRGECVGLKRLRAFTMPDIHCFCKDLKQAMEEFKLLLSQYTKLADSMEVDCVLVFRVLRDFYLRHEGWMKGLVKMVGRPALIELMKERKHYWILKHEYQFVDSVGGSAQLCTIQLDVEDSERYGIFYVDEEGKKRGYIIVHSSMGSIERWLYAVLEQAVKMKRRGIPPMLPVWLSPTQVRILPVSSDQLDEALKVADELAKFDVRVDVDDRELTLAKKVREAEVEWIPYVVTMGKEEVKGNFITVRIRGDGLKKMQPTDLVRIVKKATVGRPSLPLSLHALVSQRPKFH